MEKRTRRNRRLASQIIAFIMIFTMIFGLGTTAYADDTEGTSTEVETTQEENSSTGEVSTQSGGTANGAVTSTDLADYIKTLEIVSGETTVEHGTSVTVKFGWLIDGEIHGSSQSFTYQLPVNFDISDASTGRITKGENGPEIGTWRVDTDGLVTITYDSDYNTDAQTTINYMEITGTAKYGTD